MEGAEEEEEHLTKMRIGKKEYRRDWRDEGERLEAKENFEDMNIRRTD